MAVFPKPVRRRVRGSGAGTRVAALVAVPASALAVAAGLSGCSAAAGTASSEVGGTLNVGTGITRIDATHRAAAPPLSGTTVAGAAYAASYTGHVTVINVWGAWCTNCRKEAPSLAEASHQYAVKGVQFLGIDDQDNNGSAQAYESHFGITYPSLQDPDETLVLDLRAFVPATGVPSTIIVDRSGRVAVRMVGAITEPELDQELAYTLSEG